MRIPLGLVGVGKIARKQHLPTVAASPVFDLVAAADPYQNLPGVPHYPTLEEMLSGRDEIAAIAICTPPQMRHRIARLALWAGKHVLLEKPPCATLNELDELKALARERGCTLFTAWHSQHAPGVAAARRWMEARRPIEISVIWKEDVRVWHPGQTWIWQPHGLGVFDAGINALSILTSILPCRMSMKTADLFFPANRQAPIAADLSFVTEGGAPVSAVFDWHGADAQTWDIVVQTDDGGVLRLSNGGARLEIDGVVVVDEAEGEYGSIYARFADLISEGASEVDGRPLKHVVDAFMLGKRVDIAAFD